MSQITEQAKSFLCSNCGGTVKWNIAKQQLECASCRTPFPQEGMDTEVMEHPYEEFSQLEEAEVSFPEQAMITCSTCGAQMAFEQSRTASVCPMCGSSQVLETRQTAGVSPDGLIPFAIDKAEAQNRFRKWVKSRWFAPNKLKNAYQEGRLEGIYIPFWTFDAEAEGHYKGQGAKRNPNAKKDDPEDEQYVWFPVRGTVSESFDDLQVCAGNDTVRRVIDKILPYNTQENTIPYNSAYLSGFSAERYAIGADNALQEAEEKIRDTIRSDAMDDIRRKGYEKVELFESDLEVELFDVGYKHILLPAWVSAFAYGGKQYTYLINGENGTVTGERPYSWIKIALAAVAGIAVLAIIGSLFM